MNFAEAFVLGDISQAIRSLAHEAAKEAGKKGGKKSYATLVKEQKKNETLLRETMQKSFDEYYSRMKHGMELLGNAGLLGKIDVTKLIAFVVKKRSPESSNAIIQNEMGLSDEDMLTFYEAGTLFFEQKDFKCASDVFLVLTFLNPFVPSFWVGLGMSEEVKPDLEGASLAFLMAAEIQEEGYAWALRAADCLLKAGKDAQAYGVLDVVIEETGKSPKHAALHQEAKVKRKIGR